MMTFSAIRGAQIIDVTKDCEFQWYQEPKSCYAYLQVSSASGDFTDGETVTGQNSGATATVFSSYVNGGRVYVTNVSGTFQAGETITGDSSNQTATVDGFVAERSYPDNIIQGSFPDSIISKDIDDYLEWESTLTGSGYTAVLNITPKDYGYYQIIPVFGVGKQISIKMMEKRFYIRTNYKGGEIYCLGGIHTFNTRDLVYNFTRGMEFIDPSVDQEWWISMFQSGDGTFRWRIHNIRILKLVI